MPAEATRTQRAVTPDEAHREMVYAFNMGWFGVAYGISCLLKDALKVKTCLKRKQIAAMVAIECESKRRLAAAPAVCDPVNTTT